MHRLAAILLFACLPAFAATLYWKNDSADNSWNNVINWHTDAGATTQAANVPWTDADATYLAYDLDYATGETATIYVDITTSYSVTGTCLLSFVVTANVCSGTWSGSSGELAAAGGAFWYGGTCTTTSFNSTPSNYILGGTFTGDSVYVDCEVNSATLTFTGSAFTVGSSSMFYSGIVSGSGCTISGFVYGGLFTNTVELTGSIMSGVFTGSGFTNTWGEIYGGIFGVGTYTGKEPAYYGTIWWSKGSMLVYGQTVKSYGAAKPVTFTACPDLKISDVLGSGLQ